MRERGVRRDVRAGREFLSAALTEDAEIVEYALEQRVLLAGPMSLVSLLKVSPSAGGRRLCKRMRAASPNSGASCTTVVPVGERLDAVGKSLDQTVRAYNKAVGTLETRVFVSARKLREYGAAGSASDLPMPRIVESAARPTTIAEPE